MKKYYFFAALATVGLFASCSSDEDFVDEATSEARQTVINDEAPAKVSFGLDGITRGTGHVAGTTWQGQEFNVFMFNQKSFVLTESEGSALFNNRPLKTTPNSNVAEIKDGATVYFPTTGNFDFWAFRTDGAYEKAVAASKEITGTVTQAAYDADNNADAEKEVHVPFIIDGTQDMMIGTTKTADAYTDLRGNSTTTALSDAEIKEKIYSAYASRREVNPKFKFNHLLTRLKFQILADSKEVSEDADNVLAAWEALDPANVSNETFKGFKVTSIEVRSKSKGYIVAAYKEDATNAAEYEAANGWKKRIVFDDANEDWASPSNLPAFLVMQREKAVKETASVAFVSRGTGSGATSYTFAASYDYEDGTNGAPAQTGTITPNGAGDTYKWYITKAVDPTTKEPTGTPYSTFSAAVAATTEANVYLLVYKGGNHTSGKGKDGITNGTSLAYNVATYDDEPDMTANLVDLQPVQPKWAAATGAVAEVPVVVANEAASDATALATAQAAGKGYVKGTDGNYSLAEWKNTLAVGADYVYSDGEATPTITKFDITTAYQPAQAATDAHGVATPVGEDVFVAPADANGYEVTIRYDYWKKTSASTAELKHDGKGTVTIKRMGTDVNGNPGAIAYNQGKGYTITLRLYKNGEVRFNDDTDNAELEEDGDDDEGGANGGLDPYYSVE